VTTLLLSLFGKALSLDTTDEACEWIIGVDGLLERGEKRGRVGLSEADALLRLEHGLGALHHGGGHEARDGLRGELGRFLDDLFEIGPETNIDSCCCGGSHDVASPGKPYHGRRQNAGTCRRFAATIADAPSTRPRVPRFRPKKGARQVSWSTLPPLMIDIRLIREKADEVRAQFVRLGATVDLDSVIAMDEDLRRRKTESETLRAEQNRLSKEIGKAPSPEARQEAIARGAALKAQMEALAAALEEADRALREKLLELPNLPHPDVPVGKDDSENKTIREEGKRRTFEYTPQPHWDLGTQLGIIDFDRGVKISGSRFYVLRGAGAKLQRALISYMLDLHTEKHGYTEVLPPVMVRRECLVGTGNLPKFGDNLYRDAEEDFWFIPTAEVPVTNLYRDEILDGSTLPVAHVAFTPCFRREQLAAGRDTRGIKRGHQFDKVEMVRFVRPEGSMAELKQLLGHAEDVLRGLELPYRVVEMCTGDLSFSAMAKFDLEVWSPGCAEWLEVSSCSNFGEFQARRANIRFRDAEGKPQFVHTLNGSGLALPRTLIAVLETYQRPDGKIDIPAVLRPYMGGAETIG